MGAARAPGEGEGHLSDSASSRPLMAGRDLLALDVPGRQQHGVHGTFPDGPDGIGDGLGVDGRHQTIEAGRVLADEAERPQGEVHEEDRAGE